MQKEKRGDTCWEKWRRSLKDQCNKVTRDWGKEVCGVKEEEGGQFEGGWGTERVEYRP